MIAVIPARGGSKRVPLKNIRAFHGRPIIAYSIEAAKRSELFSQIIVSTDDERIAEVALREGAQVLMRPAELADDYVGTQAVVRHALLEVEDGKLDSMTLQLPEEYACCIYATAPFLRAQYLRIAHERLMASGKDYAFGVTGFGFPIQRALTMDENGVISAAWPEHRDTRSQDLPPRWHDAGQFYYGRARAFLDDVPLYSQHSIGIPLPQHEVCDIDDNDDWVRAERMYAATEGAA